MLELRLDHRTPAAGRAERTAGKAVGKRVASVVQATQRDRSIPRIGEEGVVDRAVATDGMTFGSAWAAIQRKN